AYAVPTAMPPEERAADITFSGRVLDGESGDPIPNVTVTLRGTSHGTVSDRGGMYRLMVPRTELASAEAVLEASHRGYERAEVPVSVVGDSVRRDIPLRPARVELAPVTAAQVAGADGGMSIVGAPPPMAVPAKRAAFSQFSLHPRHPDWNTEQYAYIEENGFLAADQNPLSTFSIDVDRASYANLRRFILEGQLLPRDAVRIEEMVNYFPYDYPQPEPGSPFSITTEVASAPWNPAHRLLRIGLRSPEVERENLPPSNLVFLIDVSGSMQGPDRLPLVKQSLRLLVNELRASDRVAIVVYAGAAGLVLPSTSGTEKTRIMEAIDRLEAGGSTAGGAGLRLAYDVARENFIRGGNNRVILATDGDFNVGVSSDAEMIRLVEERRREGTFLTVLGFGRGNLKDARMEQMADHGNGNFAYIDGLLEARKVLVSEMGGTLLTVARDVKIQVEFNPAKVRAYRLIGYENRTLAAEDFNDDRKDAGELGAGHTVTALYEVVPVGADTDVEVRDVDSLRYQTPTRPSDGSRAAELAFVKVRYKDSDREQSRLLEHPVPDRVDPPSRDLTFAAAVAGFGMLLRESEHRGSLDVHQVLELARRGQGEDPEGYRADFISLVQAYRRLPQRGVEEAPHWRW
ncbi:MAG TPA: von Willebrand factor type A domain-containing protein, partial [Longimicrobiaceae bacterium]